MHTPLTEIKKKSFKISLAKQFFTIFATELNTNKHYCS